MSTLKPLTERIRAEYAEMPGMVLTLDQVARLCGIEQSVCQMALDQLVDTKFLVLNSHGTYTRSPQESRSKPMARAQLQDSALPPISRKVSNQ